MKQMFLIDAGGDENGLSVVEKLPVSLLLRIIYR